MINTIWKTVAKMKRDGDLPMIQYPNIMVMAKYDTIDDLLQIVHNFCNNIFTALRENERERYKSLISDMINYVRNNYADYNFSVQNMADYFGMSQPNICQFFKKRSMKLQSGWGI